MKKVSLTTFALLSFACCFAQLDKSQRRNLDKLVDSQVSKNAPGLAIGIVKNGKIIFKRYAGLADIPQNIQLSDETRFNYASNGKQFTAIAILKLIAEDKISLMDDIRKYFPTFYQGIEEPILIENLLNHTSGIRDVYDLWSLQGITWWEITLSNADAFALLAKQNELNFSPGTKYMYSNSNYLLLTEIIKKVTGEEFTEYTSSLFNDLGMTSTSFESDHSKINQRVLPYGFWKKYTEYDWNSDLHGDGALFTTLGDQLTWEAIIQTQKSDVLSEELIKTSQMAIQGTGIKKYGYGLEFEIEKGYTFHHGSTGAYGATFLRYPDEKLSIVVMSNYSNISSSNIASTCADILHNIETSPRAFPRGPKETGPFVSQEELLGTYSTSGDYFYKFYERDGRLYLDRAGRDDVEIEHEIDNVYHEKADPDFKQVFVNDPEKGLQITAYYPSHDPYTLTRVNTSMQGYNFSGVNGLYTNDETDVTMEVSYIKDDLFKVISGKNEWEGQMFAPDTFWVNGFKITVIRDEGGSITSLMASGGRIAKVRFKKILE